MPDQIKSRVLSLDGGGTWATIQVTWQPMQKLSLMLSLLGFYFLFVVGISAMNSETAAAINCTRRFW
jgi:hypothetical protein